MNYIWNESRMLEMVLSGLMSGEWKRSAWRDSQAPATERVGNGYGPAYTPPRHSSTLQIPWGPVFAEKARWRGVTREHGHPGPVTEEQRSQRAFSAKTLRAADLLALAGVGSAVTARRGDAPASPPWPPPKSLAAGPHAIFRQALTRPSQVRRDALCKSHFSQLSWHGWSRIFLPGKKAIRGSVGK